MTSDGRIAAAFAAMSDQELRALLAKVRTGPAAALEVASWLGAVTLWEINRRLGCRGEIPPFRLTSDRSQRELGLVALAVLHASFRKAGPAATLLDAIGAMLLTFPEKSANSVS